MVQLAVILLDLGNDVADPRLDLLPQGLIRVRQLLQHLAVGQHQLHAVRYHLLGGKVGQLGYGVVLVVGDLAEHGELFVDQSLGIPAQLVHNKVGQGLELGRRPLLDVVGHLVGEGVHGHVLAVPQGVDVDVAGMDISTTVFPPTSKRIVNKPLISLTNPPASATIYSNIESQLGKEMVENHGRRQ